MYKNILCINEKHHKKNELIEKQNEKKNNIVRTRGYKMNVNEFVIVDNRTLGKKGHGGCCSCFFFVAISDNDYMTAFHLKL